MTYQICTNCVMDTTDPNIKFDKNGVCDHCHDFEKYVKPHWHTDKNGRSELNTILSQIKREGKDKEYDCLLGISGGVDSSYMLHLAIKELGLRPSLHVNIDETKRRHVGGSYEVQYSVQKQCVEKGDTT